MILESTFRISNFSDFRVRDLQGGQFNGSRADRGGNQLEACCKALVRSRSQSLLRGPGAKNSSKDAHPVRITLYATCANLILEIPPPGLAANVVPHTSAHAQGAGNFCTSSYLG